MFSKAQPQVFAIENNLINTDSQFVDAFDKTQYEDVAPYIDKGSVGFSGYTASMKKYNNWENEPGDFNVLEVKHGDNVIFTLCNNEGWDEMSKRQPAYTSDFCGVEKLSDDTYVLSLMGATIASQPPLLTMVAVHGNKASVVFNKHYVVTSIDTTDKTTFNLADAFQEWIGDSKSGEEPQTSALFFEDGTLFFDDF